MSQAQPHLDGTTESIGRFVRYLGAMSYVGRVFLVGSRSPFSHKEPHDGSDWDLMVERLGPGHIMWPRKWPFELHCDLMGWQPERPDAVEVWPTDEHGVFK